MYLREKSGAGQGWARLAGVSGRRAALQGRTRQSASASGREASSSSLLLLLHDFLCEIVSKGARLSLLLRSRGGQHAAHLQAAPDGGGGGGSLAGAQACTGSTAVCIHALVACCQRVNRWDAAWSRP